MNILFLWFAPLKLLLPLITFEIYFLNVKKHLFSFKIKLRIQIGICVLPEWNIAHFSCFKVNHPPTFVAKFNWVKLFWAEVILVTIKLITVSGHASAEIQYTKGSFKLSFLNGRDATRQRVVADFEQVVEVCFENK